MRILVLRGGALGDFLVTVPALRSLRHRWRDAHVELIGNARAAAVGVLDGCVQGVHSQHEARWARLYQAEGLPDELAAWLDRFDLVVSYWPDDDGDLAGQFAQRKPQYVAGSAQVTDAPAARHFLRPLGHLGCTCDDLAPELNLPWETLSAPGDAHLPLPSYAIHPGSGSPRKTWPLERWHAVARHLAQPVLWITGEAEAHLRPPDDLPHLWAQAWPLPRLAAALRRSPYYLGHDTGISHLAAAAGARGLLLFGPTDPAVWAPPTARMRVLRSPENDLAQLSVQTVCLHAASHFPR